MKKLVFILILSLTSSLWATIALPEANLCAAQFAESTHSGTSTDQFLNNPKIALYRSQSRMLYFNHESASGVYGRVHAHQAKWQDVDIRLVIINLIGLSVETVPVKSNKKVVYVSTEVANTYAIMDDPIGHYFRIFKYTLGMDLEAEKTFLDLNGQTVNQDDNDFYQSSTHFDYSDFTTEPKVEEIFAH